jgi:carbon-monoxide dehydrogenase large subunit
MNARSELPLVADDDSRLANADAGAASRFIGQSLPRTGARKLLQGRGSYLDDIRVPRLAHVVFVRSPHAHARILALRLDAARACPGVIAVVDGRALAAYCTPWVGVLGHLKGIKSAEQHAIAIDRVCSQGEAVAAIVAETRRQAEDAADQVSVDWDVLPAVTEMRAALEGSVVIHPQLGDNVCFHRELVTEGFDEAFAGADLVVEKTYDFARHTGVTNEPRGILADYNPAEHTLTVYQGTQAPHMMQDIFSRHLGIPESNVRVICKDVGGSFGIKVHVYPDEMATAALSVMLRRPVKFVADRMESFLTDIHAREHTATVRLACTKAGDIIGFDLDDLTGIGPYSVYPRTSGIEGNQVVNLTGGPYRHSHYRAKLDVVFTNKNVTCQYRAVGHPIAMALTEGIVDEAARALGMDPAQFRRRNLIADDAYPYTFPSGVKFEKLSHHQCLDKLLAAMDYEGLRAE